MPGGRLKLDTRSSIELLNWDVDVDPEFARHRCQQPKLARDNDEMKMSVCAENWVCYGTLFYSARELAVYPGRTVKVKDAGANGPVVVKGWAPSGNSKSRHFR